VFYGKKERTHELIAGVHETDFDSNVKVPADKQKSSPDLVDYVLFFRPDIRLSDGWAARIGYRNLHYKLAQKDNTDIDLDFRGVMVGFGATW